ncbi:MAG: xanthine dehydrogenase family protein subunit M [Casimicrobiaceae bacterium]
MKPAPFKYHDPRTLDEVLSLLGTLEDARLLAGGQSLMPMLNMRLSQPLNIIDLNRVEELSYIRLRGEVLEIGAMTRQRDIEFSDVVRQAFPLMHEAVRHIGHRQTRNRGTIGGSLCHLDPSAELVNVAAATGATVIVASQSGTREIPFVEFPAGLMTPAIESSEMLIAIRFPLWKTGHGYGFEEFARRHGDFALASAAALLESDGHRITRARVTVGGIAPQPQTLPAKLEGRGASEALFAEAAESCDALEAMNDVNFTGDYRRHIAKAMVKRALRKAYGRISKH